jgi:hypothetical protein
VHDFVGRWRITWMSNWDQDYVDLVEPGYVEFTDDGFGEFVFGAVCGWIDARVSTCESRIEFSWQGECEGDDLCGRGEIEFATPCKGEGQVFIHNSDESKFIIERKI